MPLAKVNAARAIDPLASRRLVVLGCTANSAADGAQKQNRFFGSSMIRKKHALDLIRGWVLVFRKDHAQTKIERDDVIRRKVFPRLEMHSFTSAFMFSSL